MSRLQTAYHEWSLMEGLTPPPESATELIVRLERPIFRIFEPFPQELTAILDGAEITGYSKVENRVDVAMHLTEWFKRCFAAPDSSTCQRLGEECAEIALVGLLTERWLSHLADEIYGFSLGYRKATVLRHQLRAMNEASLLKLEQLSMSLTNPYQRDQRIGLREGNADLAEYLGYIDRYQHLVEELFTKINNLFQLTIKGYDSVLSDCKQIQDTLWKLFDETVPTSTLLTDLTNFSAMYNIDKLEGTQHEFTMVIQSLYEAASVTQQIDQAYNVVQASTFDSFYNDKYQQTGGSPSARKPPYSIKLMPSNNNKEPNPFLDYWLLFQEPFHGFRKRRPKQEGALQAPPESCAGMPGPSENSSPYHQPPGGCNEGGFSNAGDEDGIRVRQKHGNGTAVWDALLQWGRFLFMGEGTTLSI